MLCWSVCISTKGSVYLIDWSHIMLKQIKKCKLSRWEWNERHEKREKQRGKLDLLRLVQGKACNLQAVVWTDGGDGQTVRWVVLNPVNVSESGAGRKGESLNYSLIYSTRYICTSNCFFLGGGGVNKTVNFVSNWAAMTFSPFSSVTSWKWNWFNWELYIIHLHKTAHNTEVVFNTICKNICKKKNCKKNLEQFK